MQSIIVGNNRVYSDGDTILLVDGEVISCFDTASELVHHWFRHNKDLTELVVIIKELKAFVKEPIVHSPVSGRTTRDKPNWEEVDLNHTPTELKKARFKVWESQRELQKAEQKREEEVRKATVAAMKTKLDWMDPPFYWSSKKGLVAVKDMDHSHIKAVINKLLEREKTSGVQCWLTVFYRELDRRSC